MIVILTLFLSMRDRHNFKHILGFDKIADYFSPNY